MAGENPNDTAAELLKAANDKVALLGKENADLKSENEVLTSINGELQKTIEDLSGPKSIKEAAEKKVEKAVIPTESFEVEGVSYKFIAPVFMHSKRRVTASEALLDSALLRELVSKGSTLIVKA